MRRISVFFSFKGPKKFWFVSYVLEIYYKFFFLWLNLNLLQSSYEVFSFV